MVAAKPVAQSDFYSFYESDTISGNLLSNDTTFTGGQKYLRWFDGERVEAKKGMLQETVIKGDYGTFTVQPDGTFKYEVDKDNAAVKALDAGETLVEKIAYKMSDANGTDMGYLNLEIKGQTAAPEPEPEPGLNKYLVNGLGGPAGFGENQLPVDVYGTSTLIDVSAVFETMAGGQISVGNLGYVYLWDTHTNINALAANLHPGTGVGNVSPGGNSTGSGRVWYDIDTANDTVTITWDDVINSNSNSSLNAFQIQLSDKGNGAMDVIVRYEDVAFGGYIGVTSDLSNYVENPDEVVGNTGQVGVWEYHFQDGLLIA